MTRQQFDAIVELSKTLGTKPRAAQRAAFAKLALSREHKIAGLSRFVMRTAFQRRRKEPTDRIAWTFARAAISPREVLPWEQGTVALVLRVTAVSRDYLPPELVVRALEQFAATRPKLPAPMKTWARQAANAMAPEGERVDASFRRAAARLRVLAR